MFILKVEKLKRIKDKIITKFLIDLVLYFLCFTSILFASTVFFTFLAWDIKLIRETDYSQFIRIAGIVSILFSLLFPIKARKN
jgi:hypothetical protein